MNLPLHYNTARVGAACIVLLLICAWSAPSTTRTRTQIEPGGHTRDLHVLIDNTLARISQHEVVHLVIVKKTLSVEEIKNDYDLILREIGTEFRFSGAIQYGRIQRISEMKVDRFERIRFEIRSGGEERKSVMQIVYLRPRSETTFYFKEISSCDLLL